MGCNLPHNEGVVFTCVSQSIDARTEQKNMAADLLSLFTAAAYQHQNRFGCRRGALSSLGCVPGILESLRMEMISHFRFTTTAFPQNGVLYHVKNEAEASFFEAASGFLLVALSYYGSKKNGKIQSQDFQRNLCWQIANFKRSGFVWFYHRFVKHDLFTLYLSSDCE